jgi:hypothetical protein
MPAKHGSGRLRHQGRIGQRWKIPVIKEARAEEAQKEVERWLRKIKML